MWRAANLARGRPPPTPEGLGHVAMVFVAPGHQGRGVGTALLAELARAARGVGWNRLIVWTGVDNTKALHLYERCGFMTTGRIRDKGGVAIRQFAVDL